MAIIGLIILKLESSSIKRTKSPFQITTRHLLGPLVLGLSLDELTPSHFDDVIFNTMQRFIADKVLGHEFLPNST